MRKAIVVIIVVVIVGAVTAYIFCEVHRTRMAKAYMHDVRDISKLVKTYIRYWDQNKKWPKPSTFNSKFLIYKHTRPEFRGRRRDFYRTTFDGGRQLDIVLWKDGSMDVKLIRPH